MHKSLHTGLWGDFDKGYRDLTAVPASHRGYWEVTSYAQMDGVVAEMSGAIPTALAFFHKFDSKEGVIEQLRSLLGGSETYAAARQMALPAYLAAANDLDGYALLMNELEQRYRDNAAGLRIIEKGRKIIELHYGCPPNNSSKPTPLRGAA